MMATNMELEKMRTQKPAPTTNARNAFPKKDDDEQSKKRK